ncbi:unnamed protein product [Peronospora belbahrii]|uniref:Uncharacterized protein n=1 Tax=Peronospora belbahrii TaxID=622444 RepID=A0AAU9KW13_9STRA|nr:unnamed protein product [Peronospora belbahrii]CAH0520166.1 unnamed protein product [Peronospora belbahrii]
MTALFGVALAGDIDNGFAHDGATTYCMGKNDGVGALIFGTLEASNVGCCSVGVTLTLTESTFHVNEPITVKWAAKMIPGLTNSIFPNAIDPATGLPRPVKTSTLSACTAGTNCAVNVAAVPTGADGTSTGEFAADGTKTLETATFTLATPGDYTIVGLVALPGESTLNLASEEYVVFKKISVVSAETEIATTLIPGSANPSIDSSNPSIDSSNVSKDSLAKQESTLDLTSDKSAVKSDSMSLQDDKTVADPISSASTSSSGGINGSGVAIIAIVAGCCIVGLVGFAFVMRRRKQEHAIANKGFNTISSSLASDMNDSALGDDNDGKIDLTYIANVTARNNDMNAAENMMSEESSVAVLASVERGSELNPSNGNSSHLLPKSSLDTDVYSDKASYAVAGTAGHQPKGKANNNYGMSNTSMLSPRNQSEASTSNFGDSAVSTRQYKHFQNNDWNGSLSSHMDSRLDSMEQSELKARGFGSIAGLSVVSGSSEDNTSRISGISEHDVNFSMSSRPTEDSRATIESRFTAGYHETEDSRITEDSRVTGFSEAMHQSRLQSEKSTRDSYGFRTSRSSADSYSSGMSSFSREDSRISGFSVDSNLDSPNGSSKY